MADIWLADDTVIEGRLACLRQGRLVLLRHFPKVGPAALAPRVGDVFAARVRAKAAGGRFLDLGAAGEGFVRGAADLPDGAMIRATVVQAAIPNKVARLALKMAMASDAGEVPRRLEAGPDAIRTVMERARRGDRVRVASAALFQALKAWSEAHELHVESAGPGLFEEAGAEAAIEGALDPLVPLPAGGRLVVEMTQALTAIDVDTASAKDAGAVNAAAARAIPFEITARELAGTIIADFAAVRERRALQRLAASLDETARSIGLDLDISLGRRGLLDIRRPRAEAPLAVRLTKAGVTHLAVKPVLRFEVQAARAARLLARAGPRAGYFLRLPPSLLAWLQEEGAAVRDALLKALPARIGLADDAGLEPDGVELGG